MGLVGIAQLRLTEKKREPRIVGRLLHLILNTLDSRRRLTALEVQISESFLRRERAGIVGQCLMEKGISVGPAFLLGTQKPKLNVANRILRRGLNQAI